MADHTDPDALLDFIKRARANERADAQSVADSHIGMTATTILLHNQARIAARLLGADPNAVVDILPEAAPGEVTGSPVPATEPAQPSPTTPEVSP